MVNTFGDYHNRSYILVLAIANNLSKRVRHTPRPAPQARQLHNLAMIHEQVDVDPKLSNVPVKHLWIGCLEHDTLHRQLPKDRLDNIRTRTPHVFCDALALDHETLHASIQAFLSEVNDFRRVARSRRFQLRDVRVATRAELNAQFGFGCQPMTLYFFNQSQPVVWWE